MSSICNNTTLTKHDIVKCNKSRCACVGTGKMLSRRAQGWGCERTQGMKEGGRSLGSAVENLLVKWALKKRVALEWTKGEESILGTFTAPIKRCSDCPSRFSSMVSASALRPKSYRLEPSPGSGHEWKTTNCYVSFTWVFLSVSPPLFHSL